MTMWNPNEDGLTHINVYSKGRTELGRWLSNFAYAPFNHPSDGYFASVEAYWYWLSTSHPQRDELRSLHGYAAKQRGRALRGADWPKLPDFEWRIKFVIWLKCCTYPQMLNALQASTLPFSHYYVYGTTVRDVPEATWMLDELNRIREYRPEIGTP